jgi:hypothetical protein
MWVTSVRPRACALPGEFSSANRAGVSGDAGGGSGLPSPRMDPDHEMSARNTVILLERLWRKSGERLAARCCGLADEELLWEPVEDSWNLVPDAAHPGGWTYPYDFDPPHPHPVTSIGWRFVHLIGDNEIYMEHAFGPGLRNFPDLLVHGTADEVLVDWANSRRPVTAWLTSATDSDLLELRPSHLGGSTTAGEVMTILAGRANTPRS